MDVLNSAKVSHSLSPVWTVPDGQCALSQPCDSGTIKTASRSSTDSMDDATSSHEIEIVNWLANLTEPPSPAVPCPVSSTCEITEGISSIDETDDESESEEYFTASVCMTDRQIDCETCTHTFDLDLVVKSFVAIIAFWLLILTLYRLLRDLPRSFGHCTLCHEHCMY